MQTLEEAITALQSSPGGPLAEIRRRGVRGVPYSPCNCLVARALAASAGDKVWVSGGAASHKPGASERVRLTKDLLDIVRDFDAGKYPELEERG
jgi:hypothetical protein